MEKIDLQCNANVKIEKALYSREIIEDEYNERIKKIKEQTRIFDEKCSCLKSTDLINLEKKSIFS